MSKYILTTGSGNSKYALNAFDNALLDSGIADFNLVKLSSILPPNSHREESVDLPKGSFLHTAFSRCIENQAGMTISAAIAIAIPRDKALPGIIMEISGEHDKKTAEEIVMSMVKIAMESRGIIEYEVEKRSVSMITEDGFNCVVAAVSIW